jgi:hypothetical protein
MDFSQLLQPGSIVTLVVICVIIVIIGAVLGFVVNFLGSILGVIGSTFGLFTDFLAGGPIVWCGCIVGIVLLALCAISIFGVASLLSSCGTPQAINLCSLFGS